MDINYTFNNLKHRPISQSEFNSMSKEDQVLYVDNLAKTYGASCLMISKMLNMHRTTLNRHMNDIGYRFNGKKGIHSSKDVDEWERFLGIGIVADNYIAPGDTSKVNEPNQTIEDVAKMIEDNNDAIESFNLFIDECCTVGSDVIETRFDVLFDVYRFWCMDNEFSILNRNDTMSILRNMNTQFIKNKGYVFCSNIFLKMDVYNKYRGKLYQVKPNQSPYYNPKSDAKKSVKKNKVTDKVEDKKSADTSKVSLVHISGELEYEGLCGDIMIDAVTKMSPNKKMRIKIQWEVIE